MNLLSAQAIGIGFGAEPVLTDVTLGIGQGDRIGVVGRNGAGKSTLLKVLIRELPPDRGRVTHTGGLRLGVLPQSAERTGTAGARPARAPGASLAVPSARRPP
ncbi:MAG: ATP-binding cassette domain-containing protein, partial [Mycobacteriales bacterium]